MALDGEEGKEHAVYQDEGEVVGDHCGEYEDKVPKAYHGEDVAEGLEGHSEEGGVQARKELPRPFRGTLSPCIIILTITT